MFLGISALKTNPQKESRTFKMIRQEHKFETDFLYVARISAMISRLLSFKTDIQNEGWAFSIIFRSAR